LFTEPIAERLSWITFPLEALSVKHFTGF